MAPESGVTQKLETTTLSTIVLRSKETQVIIALLRSGSEIDLKLLEMKPDLGYLGETFEEAGFLQTSHNDVLLQMESKQNPVEDMLRKADELIVNQKPKAGVYSAMAESLGTAWQEIHRLLECRKSVVDKNFLFRGHLQDYVEKVNRLKIQVEKASLSLKNPERSLMRDLKLFKRKMLEASAFALQEGEGLLQLLHQTWQETSPGMTPQHVRTSISASIEQVEQLLETIHDRRIGVTKLLQLLSIKYDRCSALENIRDHLETLDKQIKEKQDYVNDDVMMTRLGTSQTDVESMAQQMSLILMPEGQDFSNQAADLSDRLHRQRYHDEHFHGEIIQLAFQVMENSALYLTSLEHRMGILNSCKAFFQDATDVDIKLNEIESTLNNLNNNSGRSSNDLVQQLNSLKILLEKIIQEISDQGKALMEKVVVAIKEYPVDDVDRNKEGVQAVINTLKLKGKNLIEICTFNLNHVKRSSRTWNNFQFKLTEFDQWLEKIMQEQIKQNNSMGQNIEEVSFFLKSTKELLGHVQVKMYELEGMKGALKVMLNDNDESNHNKATDNLIAKVHEKIRKLSRTLEDRITISSKYVKFLKLANDLTKEMQTLEDEFLVTKSEIRNSNTEMEQAQQYEARRLTIQQLYLQVCNASKNCIHDLNANNEAFILKDPVECNINLILSNLNRAQSILIEMWSTISSQMKASQEFSSTKRIVENLIEQVEQIQQRICPLMNTDDDPAEIVSSLESSYATLTKAKALVSGLEQLAKDVKGLEENKEIVAKTQELSFNLEEKIIGFEHLLKSLIAFIKHLAEARMITNDIHSKGERPLSSNLHDIEMAAEEHDAYQKSVDNKFNQLKVEARTIQTEIQNFEKNRHPRLDKNVLNGNQSLFDLVNFHEKDFVDKWQSRKVLITRSARFSIFKTDCNNIEKRLDEIIDTIHVKLTLDNVDSRPLLSIATSFLEDLKSATVPGVNKDFEMLTKKSLILQTDLPLEQKSSIQDRINQLDKKLGQINRLITDREKTLDAVQNYCQNRNLMEKFVKVTHLKTLNWSRKLIDCKTVEDCDHLHDELTIFLNKTKPEMNQHLNSLIEQAYKIFGHKPIIGNNKEDDHGGLQSIQNEHGTILESISNILIDIDKKKKNLEVGKILDHVHLVEEMTTTKQSFHVEQQVVLDHPHHQEVPQQQPPPRPPPPVNQAPHFEQLLMDSVLVEGQRLVFSAKVNGIPTPNITWFKDGISVIGTGNTDYKTYFDESSGICQLLIEETFMADSANWSIRASNIGGYAESHAKLTVKEIKPAEPEGQPPTLITPLNQVNVNEGETAFFSCHVDGQPMPKFSWYKNGALIEPGAKGGGQPHFSIKDFKGESALRIGLVGIKDNGLYTCKATNCFGVVSSSANLMIATSEIREAPMFNEPLVNVEVTTGQPLHLECQISGLPSPEISWRHNNKPIQQPNHHHAGQFEIKYDPQSQWASLTVKEAFPKVSGRYTCRARNTAGEATTTAVVCVKGIPPTEVSDTEAMNESDPKFQASKPAFYVPLKNQHVTEGEEVVLESVIVSTPSPKVFWYKNNIPIVEIDKDDRIQIKHYGDVFKLILKNVNGDFSGEYKVRAENIAGECQSTCTVHINQPSTTYEKLDNVFSRAPLIRKPLIGISADVGDRITLEVIVEGQPLPKIQWYKDNRLLQSRSPSIVMHRDGNVCRLLIQRAEASTMGTYRIVAANDHGITESNCEVEVRPPPPRPPLPYERSQTPRTPSPSGRHQSLPPPSSKWRSTPSPKFQSGRRSSSAHLSISRKLAKESSAMQTLSSFRSYDRPLPPLEPFPFVPDQEFSVKRKIPVDKGKVPTPSKFHKGEMYHSDYESDLESPIKTTWRPYHSDTEDLEAFAKFRSVKPKLKTAAATTSSSRKTNADEPPCPHQWESHEDIEKLEREMQKSRMDFEKVERRTPAIIDGLKRNKIHERVQKAVSVYSTTSSSSTNEVSAKNVVTSKRPMVSIPTPPPQPTTSTWSSSSASFPRTTTSVKRPTTSSSPTSSYTLTTNSQQYIESSSSVVSDDISQSSHSTSTVMAAAFVPEKKKNNKMKEFISVKEKARLLEEMVSLQQQQQQQLLLQVGDDGGGREGQRQTPISINDNNTNNDNSDETGAAMTQNQRSTPTIIRPEEIPGAVRVLPPGPSPAESRRGSRSASADLFGHKASRASPIIYDRAISASAAASPLTLPRVNHKSYTNSSTFKWLSKKAAAANYQNQCNSSSSSKFRQAIINTSTDQGFSSGMERTVTTSSTEVEDCPPTIELTAFRNNNEVQSLPTTLESKQKRQQEQQQQQQHQQNPIFEQQGYDGDTDDTLMRRSVKDLAKSFSSDYESCNEDFETANITSRVVHGKNVAFDMVHQNSKDGVLVGGGTNNKSYCNNSSNRTTPVFRPSKFVPGKKSTEESNQSWSSLESSGPIPSIWRPPSSTSVV